MRQLLLGIFLLNLSPAVAGAVEENDVPRFWRWAAIARSRTKLLRREWPLGNAVCEASQDDAQRLAIQRCQERDCEISVYVETGCIAAATGYDPRTTMIAEGSAAKQYARRVDESFAEAKAVARAEATATAILQCNLAISQGQSAEGPCRARQVFCTWDVPAGRPPVRPQ